MFDALRAYLSPRKESDLNLVPVKEAIPDSIIYLQLAIFVLSGILIVIAIVNVFIMSLLTAQEKLRVIGILKTVGMTPAQVVRMFNITAGSLGTLAVLIGIPLGLVVTQNLLTVLVQLLWLRPNQYLSQPAPDPAPDSLDHYCQRRR